MPSHEIQFIIDDSGAPSNGGRTGPSQRSLARSHAARAAHAKTRRQRIIQYQNQKAQDRDRDQESENLSHRSSGSPTNLLSHHRRDPFHAQARSLNPTEEFLIDHYITAIVPAMTCNTFDPAFYMRAVKAWVPYILTTPGLPDTLLLASSRHLSLNYPAQQQQQQQQLYSNLLYQYKLQLLASVREAISVESPGFTDTTIIKAIMLAYDEIWAGDKESLKRHVDGAIQMVTLKGGPQVLGLDGMIERLLFNLVAKVNPMVRLSVKGPYDPRICSMELGPSPYLELTADDVA
ncbi:hypothetical protein BJY04DRAFT_49382 [Aspergillus karnatakaensis]|uniref:uncharacterized protein n=1 Tax=Aspergillus karnatakaensis TaxID=1810916 RepID=UPI003CCE112F